ncbi:hypothetical protein [Allosphingosinicella sp.]|uniref:hypothetical protein n=1 Tax=Allosphingosinicella sp. TaxID=2823234 RepID=UPI0037845D62
MAKLTIDLQRGLIEVDGDEKFVERVYADVRETLLTKLAAATVEPDAPGEQSKSAESETPKRAKRRPRTGGPSCAGRIESIKDEGFFKQPKAAAEVREKLKEKGTTYGSNNVAAALNNLTKAGKLRRFNENGWKYQNP